MLNVAFVWATAPHGKFYWEKQWRGLAAGRELTPKAFAIIFEIAQRDNRQFNELEKGLDNSIFLKRFKIV